MGHFYLAFIFLLILKELRNYYRKLFLCPPQKKAKAHQTFKNAIFKKKKKKNTLVHQNKCLNMEN